MQSQTLDRIYEIINISTKNIRPSTNTTLLKVLWDLCEDSPEYIRQYTFVERLGFDIAATNGSSAEALSAVATAAMTTTSLFVFTGFVGRQEHKQKSGRADFPTAELDAMRQDALRRIDDAANDRSLICRTGLHQILLRWESWSSLDVVRKWVAKTACDRESTICFLRGMVQFSETIAPRFRRNFYIDIQVVERWLNLETLDHLVEMLGPLSDDETEVVRMYLKKKGGPFSDDQGDD